MSTTLKRYTELPFLLHALRTKELALLSPSSWDDRNDALYMERYRKQRPGVAALLALCLTEAYATYHHWKVFAGTSSGVCIVFDPNRLVRWATANGIRCGRVRYKSLRRARLHPPIPETLPFRKRHAFRDEKEFRLVYESAVDCGPVKTFTFKLNTIDHIVVNPWMPEPVFESVRASIQELPQCESITVAQSHMLTNKEWANMGADA